MPKPKPEESKKDFISRCISVVAKEKRSWDKDRVVAYCYVLWEKSKENSE